MKTPQPQNGPENDPRNGSRSAYNSRSYRQTGSYNPQQGTSQTNSRYVDPNSTLRGGYPSNMSPDKTIIGNNSPNSSMASGTMWRGMLPPHEMTSKVQAMNQSMTTLNIMSGNVGRLWISEAFSRIGDSVLGVGAIIWLTQLTYSFGFITLLLICFAAPPLLVAMTGRFFSGRRDPRTLVFSLELLRICLAGLFIAMYFRTIIPVTLLLAFGLALASSLRSALRRGSIYFGTAYNARSKVSSGDQLAAGAISVTGPAIAMLLYIVNGERIFTIAIGAIICYVFALLFEMRVTPLPPRVLYTRYKAEEDENASVWEGDEDDEDEDTETRLKRAAAARPVWELMPPDTLKKAIIDINDGLRIAGSMTHSFIAVLLLAALATAGGVLAIYEPFYIGLNLHQAPVALGLLFTAAGLGAAAASAIIVEIRRWGRFFLFLGAVSSGVALIRFAQQTDMRAAFIAAAVLGGANVLAIRGGQMTMLRSFRPPEQRAVSAAADLLLAISSILGILLGAYEVIGKETIKQFAFFPILGINDTLISTGVFITLLGAVCALFLLMPNKTFKIKESPAPPLPDTTETDDSYDDYEDSGYDDNEDYDDRETTGESRQYRRVRQRGYEDYSGYYPAAQSGYDDDEDGEDDRQRRRR